MLKLKEDLKNGIYRRAYLLYGDEPYLQNMYKNRLLNAVTDPDDTMNLSKFQGKGINPKEIIDLAETLPFFSEHRVILIENSGFFKTSCEELAAYLPELPETTILIFVEEAVDKRGKMFKAVKALGGVAEFRVQTDEVLAKWIVQALRREGRRITGNVLQLFMSRCGTSMENIENEMEKLISYTWGRTEITAQDVEDVCTGQITNQIFKMIDAIAGKQKKEALNLYYDLLALKEPSMRILFLIVRQFQILMQVKDLGGKGYDNQTIAKKASIPVFIVRKNLGQARSFTMAQIRRALELGVQAEENVKTGRMNDQLAVELMIISCME